MGNFICSKTESTIDPNSFRKQPTQMMNYEKACKYFGEMMVYRGYQF